ncbi:MAG: SpoIIE family protein phosphatase [Bacteroidota bacterium]|nr:SpoIIE family protein phosphatase [Bacteroidota bacterium]
MYSLFYTKFPKQHKIFLVAAAVSSILSIIVYDAIVGSLILGIIVLIEVIRVVILALKKKLKGAKIIGIGFGLFALFILIVLFVSLIFGGFNIGGQTIVFLFFILSIISIPLSMSIFLAWDFSQTNKNLKMQLVKNEELSEQTIAQAKEKQELLANQNKFLEEQVEERTREINEQKKELHLKNVEITDSINYSKHIQIALLPEEEDIKLALPGSFILYQPKDIVSGDFYWFHKIDKSSFNQRQPSIINQQSSILIAAADCTGHGVPGALMSLIAIENLNKAIEFEQEPCKILELVNKNIKNALKQNTDKSAKDGMDIALCKIEQLSETSFKVLFSAANRPLWIVRHNAKDVEEIKATKTAIGGHTDYNQIFEQHVLEFSMGDTLYMFSDGYADQFGSDKNKKLTTKRFKEILLEINNLPPEEQKQYLQNYIFNWKGKLEQIDDILVIGLKF